MDLLLPDSSVHLPSRALGRAGSASLSPASGAEPHQQGWRSDGGVDWTTWWWGSALLAPEADVSGGKEKGTLGPGSSLAQCLHRVFTVEAELFWKALVRWEKADFIRPAPHSFFPACGSYYRAKTGSEESLEAGFLREAQGLGSDCVPPLRLGR